MKEGRCLIIGGGPAGLTAATRPQIKPIAFVLGEFFGLCRVPISSPQPRGLFTRGQTVCLVFGHCFLTLAQPLFLFLENGFGSIACLISVDIQLRYSFPGEVPRGQTSLGDPMSSADVGLVN
jgi:hypothetical protein